MRETEKTTDALKRRSLAADAATWMQIEWTDNAETEWGNVQHNAFLPTFFAYFVDVRVQITSADASNYRAFFANCEFESLYDAARFIEYRILRCVC